MKNINEGDKAMKEEILKGYVHSIDEMKVWLWPLDHDLIGSPSAFIKGK